MRVAHPARGRYLAVTLGLLLPLVSVSVAFAQDQGGGGAGPAGGGGSGGSGGTGGGASGTPAGGGGTTGTNTTTTTTQTVYPGGVMPLPPGATLGGGNAQFSSSKPITGNERDTFDFKRGGAAGTVRGGDSSSFVIGGGDVRGSNATVHNVHKGDTLWGICDHYFRNPYQWPRIWSYNPQIQNPHWIFPGDQVRLRGGELATATAQANNGQGLTDRRRQVPPDTIFLRNEGYIEDESNSWGEISGSAEEKMFLTDLDEVYLRISGNHDVKIGQELTIFRPAKAVGGGRLIQIQGTAKVDQWNPKEGIARAKIIETLDTIERGARVGPVVRRFEVVPPARNDADVVSTVLTSVQPHGLYGQNQIVFVDKGEDAGLKPGNRLFILRKGDGWSRSLTTAAPARRIALEDESPAATEVVPRPRDSSVLPEETVAELRVISVRKKTSLTLVITSHQEIEPGDRAYLRKGY